MTGFLQLIGFCPWNRPGCKVVFVYWRRDKARTCRNGRCRRVYYRAMHAKKPENVTEAKRLTSNYYQQELLDHRLERIPPDKRERSKERFLERFVGRCAQQQRGCRQIVFLRKRRLMVCTNSKCVNRYWTNRARKQRRTLQEIDDL